MSRSLQRIAIVAVVLSCLSLAAQRDPVSIQKYFVGKEVVLKIDMPGTQQGVDLRYNKDTPMNWKEYANRLKRNGVAIPKGATARVTDVVVKDDRIEFQLDGGGFGTFLDDSSTTVAAKNVEKSDYEKQLERQIADMTDGDKKRSLQRDLDRERSRRQRQEADNRAAAQVASQLKAQQVADKRLQGGSRFNLRWSGSIPPDQKTPEAVMKLLAEYVSFDSQAPAVANSPQNVPTDAAVSPTAQLKRGMKMEEVTNLFGPGKQLSQSVSPDGLRTEIVLYLVADRSVQVTYVEGLVVRFSISSN